MELENVSSTAPETAASGELAEAVTPQETQALSSQNDDFRFTEADDRDEAPEEEAERQPKPEKRVQTREENAVWRLARLQAQREAEAAERARTDSAIAALNISDPYNKGKKLTSLSELQRYSAETQRRALAKRARQEGRSVEDVTEDEKNRAFLSELRRTAERQEAETLQRTQAAAARKAFIEADALDFKRRHPEVGPDDLAELENNPQFRQFCGSRYGREPMADLYDSYCSLMGNAGSAAVAQQTSRAVRSTGGGSGGSAILSPSQKKTLDKWNANHPEMAMTAKEFLGR